MNIYTTDLIQDLFIRQATKEDIPFIEKMYEARVKYNDAHDIHQWYIDEVRWSAFSKTYEISDYYVGIYKKTIVCGFFIVDVDALYWPDKKQGEALYLHKICVDPKYKGRGFADCLIAFFKNKGCYENYPMVRLDVRERKSALRSMYERNGFTLVGTGRFNIEFTTALYEYKCEEKQHA
ncbi:MAG: GNAT family N-acetyltransferase [Longicatena sp.]